MRNIRRLPPRKQRVETGAVRFGNDWPGLFIRGDDCIGMVHVLEQALEEGCFDQLSAIDMQRLIGIIRNDVLSPLVQ